MQIVIEEILLDSSELEIVNPDLSIQAEELDTIEEEQLANRFSFIDEVTLELQITEPIYTARYLINVLENSTSGITLLNYYKRNHDLKPHFRGYLADKIIDWDIRSSLTFE